MVGVRINELARTALHEAAHSLLSRSAEWLALRAGGMNCAKRRGMTRAERRRSRGDNKRGDLAESPEPVGRQAWQIAGQIEMPRPPNPIMKRSRRPRPPNHRRLSACFRR